MPGRAGREPKTQVLLRLAWFAALWLAGVGTVGAVAYILRIWIG